MRWNPGHFALFTEEVEDVIGFDKTRSSDYGVDLIMHAFYLFINPHDLSVFLQSRWFSLRTEGMWRLCTMGVHSKKKKTGRRNGELDSGSKKRDSENIHAIVEELNICAGVQQKRTTVVSPTSPILNIEPGPFVGM